MSQQYRILSGKSDNKPIDMVVIMRRIRSGKITHNTLICVGDSDVPVPAGEIKELARFFRDDYAEDPFADIRYTGTKLSRALKAGWQFTIESNIMTVYAGGALILGIIFGLILISKLGMAVGIIINWFFVIILHQLYYLFVIRMFRGQSVGEDFMNKQFAPIAKSLAVSSLIYAVIVGSGFLLLIIPGIIMASWMAFVPILIMDKKLAPVDSIRQSIIFVRNLGKKEFMTVFIILTLHIVCLFLLVPVPLTMPLFLAALCEIYEKNSS